MAESQLQSGIANIEALLLRRSVISGTFSELAHQRFDNNINYRRLGLVALVALICVRYIIIFMFNETKVLDMLGDVLWTLGVMGFFINCVAFMLAFISVWYLLAIAYCEYHGQLGFLNYMNVASKTKSNFTTSLNAKLRLIHNVIAINAIVVPYVNGTGIYGLCIWNAFQVNNSIPQMLLNIAFSALICISANSIVVVVFSVSALVYLSASVIGHQFSTLYDYFNICKDPFTLNRVLEEYTEVIFIVNEANKFIKYVLGSVNFLAVPVVSLMLSIFSVHDDGVLLMCFVFATGGSFLALLVSTAAFMASVHYKVLKYHVT